MLVLGITDNIARSNYFFIAKTEATSSAVASLDFSSIPQEYTHLEIRLICNNTVGTADTRLRFNGDSGATQYSYQFGYGDGGGQNLSSNNGAAQTIVGSSRVGVTGVASHVITIENYRNTNVWKSLSFFTIDDTTTIRKGAGLWKSGSAITSLSLSPASNNFGQYSVAALYGIK